MNKTNAHVERLQRYLPFNPAHDQIYEEYQNSKDSLSLDTKALKYLVQSMNNLETSLIILTGDAGHGKTHLCRRLLEEHHGYSQDEARGLINSECDGTHVIKAKNDARSIIVHKDFSELDLETAAKLIEKSFEPTTPAMIICANEGRLRAVLASEYARTGCQQVFDDFSHSFETGLCSRDGAIHIINLNYQSVAASDGVSLLGDTLHDWLSGTRWTVCKDCDAQKNCPIFNNRNLLDARQSKIAERRRQRIETLFSTLERLGVVITIREMLMAVAYFITGGLTCSDIHSKSSKDGWQHTYTFYNLLFSRPSNITKDMLARIPVMTELPRLDPGAFAARNTDERLINEQNNFPKKQLDLRFKNDVFKTPPVIDASEGIDEVIGNPNSRKDRENESKLIELIVRCLRRRAFFDDGDEHTPPLLRLGFENADDFDAICTETLPNNKMARLKNRMLSGLHVIQGLQMSRSETNLFLVDPAFGNATSHAAIIARTIPTSSIKLLSMSEAWEVDHQDGDRAMARSVDWIDRHIVLRVKVGDGFQDLPLDLMSFDCLCRAGGGYVAEEFYAHDLKRIKTYLGKLAENLDDVSGSINLFINGQMHSVSIDEGMIQVGGDLV